MPKVGMRVKVKSLGIKGKITYIDQPYLYQDHFHPIQLGLDKPYDDSGQTMYRTNIKDLIKLKKKKPTDTPTKKKPKKKKASFDDEAFVF